MSVINEYINRIHGKLQQLVKSHEQLKADNAKFRSQVAELREQQASMFKQVEELKQQNMVLKASLQSLEPAEKKELESRLTQYIKTIDKSISLLSQ